MRVSSLTTLAPDLNSPNQTNSATHLHCYFNASCSGNHWVVVDFRGDHQQKAKVWLLILLGKREHSQLHDSRGTGSPESWNPTAGDIIVSNWASWIELLWLAFRWNPLFLLPVVEELPVEESRPATPQITPGRRTGTGSAAISTPAGNSSSRARTPIVGFKPVSLLPMIHHTGSGPLTRKEAGDVRSLEDIRSKANRPVVVFPECTTSNGRALLRFADILTDVQVPVRKFRVFIMCVR